MNAKDLINQIAKQCGFNDQSKTRRGEQGETTNKSKTRRGEAKLDWPTVKEQEEYWNYRDEHLAEIESNAQFYDETLRDAGRNSDGTGESLAERNH